ncbi:MAG: hypothetical protein KY458_07830 [Actinobacteria bacterium]|nr:hypothetical protein [Actinomycetota bacterium]
MTATATASAGTPQAPPHEPIWELAEAIVASRSLHVVAELGVADHVGDGPVPAEDLAAACGADPDALERVLRLLATHGIFEPASGGYRHTKSSLLLRSDHPMSMRAFARLNGLPVFSATFGELEHSVRTGSPALELVAPNGLWPYLQEHPEEAAVFEEAMTAKAHADVAAVLDVYDFSRHRRIADVGGGHAHLIEAILDKHHDVTGVLFELPHVADEVAPSPRLEVISGDFFTDPLPGCDAYLMMNILHDWDDERASAILAAVAKSSEPGAAVLVVETVMPEGPEQHWAKTLDVLMLAVTGGRERTEAEYRRLLGHAGIDLVRTLPTATPFSVVEGRVR